MPLTTLVAVTGLRALIGLCASTLFPWEQEFVRDAVSEMRPILAPIERGSLLYTVVVPDAITGLYKKNPAGTLRALRRIVEDGSPGDSVAAAAYANEMVLGPTLGAPTLRMYDEDTYDVARPGGRSSRRVHADDLTSHLAKAISKGARADAKK